MWPSQTQLGSCVIVVIAALVLLMSAASLAFFFAFLAFQALVCSHCSVCACVCVCVCQVIPELYMPCIAFYQLPGWWCTIYTASMRPYYFVSQYQRIFSILVMLYASYIMYTAHTLDWWAYFRLWWANDFFPFQFLCKFVWGLCEHCHAPLPGQSAKELQHKTQMFQLKKRSISLFPSLSLPPSPPVECLSAMRAYLPINKN